MKIFKYVLIFIFLVVVILICFLNINKNKFNVLHISSYHPDYAWDIGQEKGIRAAFEKKHISYDYRVFYLDTKVHTDEKWKLQRSQEAIDLIKKTKPDVVIVSDDNAMKYVAAKMKNTEYKFVFTGVDHKLEAYGLPASNITGVIERHLYEENIKLLKIFKPDVEKIAVLTDDSETSEAMVKQFEEAIPGLPVKVVGIHLISAIEEWKEYVQNYQRQNTVDAFFIIKYHLKDKLGNKVPSQDVIRWTVNNSKIPEVGTYEYFVQDGGMASVALTAYGQGYQAAIKAIDILHGKKPSEIKIERTYESKIYINSSRVKSLNLNLPKEFKDFKTQELIFR